MVKSSGGFQLTLVLDELVQVEIAPDVSACCHGD
jgi:hypothetical protein